MVLLHSLEAKNCCPRRHRHHHRQWHIFRLVVPNCVAHSHENVCALSSSMPDARIKSHVSALLWTFTEFSLIYNKPMANANWWKTNFVCAPTVNEKYRPFEWMDRPMRDVGTRCKLANATDISPFYVHKYFHISCPHFIDYFFRLLNSAAFFVFAAATSRRLFCSIKQERERSACMTMIMWINFFRACANYVRRWWWWAVSKTFRFLSSVLLQHILQNSKFSLTFQTKQKKLSKHKMWNFVARLGAYGVAWTSGQCDARDGLLSFWQRNSWGKYLMGFLYCLRQLLQQVVNT